VHRNDDGRSDLIDDAGCEHRPRAKPALRHVAAVAFAVSLAWTGTANAAMPDATVIGRGVNPRIAVNNAGVAIAVWQRRLRSAGLLVAAVRSSSGRWSSHRTIGTTGSPRLFERRRTPMDVAIDDDGNVVVVWTRMRAAVPERANLMTARRPAGGRWSAPRVLARVRSPSQDVSLGPGGTRLRAQVRLDASGRGVAVWARLVDQGRPDPATAQYVVEAATMGADGVWGLPQILGGTHTHPALDVTRGGDAVVAWSSGTVDARLHAWLTRAVLVAERPVGGQWSVPEVVVADQATQGQDLEPPDVLFDAKAVLERDGRVSMSWRRSRGVFLELQAATDTGAAGWSAPVTLEESVEFSDSAFLGADSRGEVNAIWVGELGQDTNDVELRAATRDALGNWSVPKVLARAIASYPSQYITLTGAGVSAEGQVVALLARSVQGSPERTRSSLRAYVRTPDHTWLRPKVLYRAGWRAARPCVSADLAVADQSHAVAVWSCRAKPGRAANVMFAQVTPAN
jgi:hypothetical protein